MMSEQITEDPQMLAATRDLGVLREKYRPAIVGTIIIWSVLMVLEIAGVFSYLFSGSMSSLQPGVSVLFFVIVLALILLSVTRIRSTYKNRLTSVLVYDRGLVYRGRDGLLTIRWEDIVQVEHEVIAHRRTSTDGNGATTVHTSYDHRYIVRCFEGTYLKLDENFVGLRRLGKTIEERSGYYLLPAAMKMLLADETVYFGVFSASMFGIRVGDQLLPWGELGKINIDERIGSVAIRRRGQLLNWTSVRLADVPNVVVFKRLAEKMANL